MVTCRHKICLASLFVFKQSCKCDPKLNPSLHPSWCKQYLFWKPFPAMLSVQVIRSWHRGLNCRYMKSLWVCLRLKVILCIWIRHETSNYLLIFDKLGMRIGWKGSVLFYLEILLCNLLKLRTTETLAFFSLCLCHINIQHAFFYTAILYCKEIIFECNFGKNWSIRQCY